jgi:hypothetical protein
LSASANGVTIHSPAEESVQSPEAVRLQQIAKDAVFHAGDLTVLNQKVLPDSYEKES